MTSAPVTLWSEQGRVRRLPFFCWGLLLLAIKYPIDFVISRQFFERTWLPTDYFSIGAIGSALAQSADHRMQLMTLLLCAMPFVWIGVMLCAKRLRDAGYPCWLVLLFFLPPLNLLLFITLCIAPSTEDEQGDQEGDQPAEGPASRLALLIPADRWTAAALAVPLTASLGVIFTVIGANWLGDYGWTVFVALPFCQGMIAVFIYNFHTTHRYSESLIVAQLSVALVGLLMILVAIEGIICLLMAAPIWMIAAAMGASFAYSMVAAPGGERSMLPIIAAILISLPAMLATDAVSNVPAPLGSVTTRVVVNAPPHVVWRQVIAFPKLDEPRELIFRGGVAYPMSARIEGVGVGAIRYCEFSTGPFVEPITAWNRPHHLAFDVVDNPQPMRELSPYKDLHPPHLDGFMASQRGEFRLTALPGRRTQLDGTTWYTNRMWPQVYWRMWSDMIIHTIHNRVLTHIKTLAESKN